jgi:hypothetical protein
MATSPVPQWAQEMSPHHRGPTGAGVLRLAVIVLLVVLVLQLLPTTDGGQVAGGPTAAACATSTHTGRSARRQTMAADFQPWPYQERPLLSREPAGWWEDWPYEPPPPVEPWHSERGE